MRYPFIIIPGLFLVTTLAQAQESQNPNPPGTQPEFTIDELLNRATGHYPSLRAAHENVTAARETVRAASTWPSLVLQITPGFTGSREARDEEVILAQPLDMFGLRRARSRVASAQLSRAQTESESVHRALAVSVKSAVIALYGAQEAEALDWQRLDIATKFRDAATRRAQLGDVPEIQVQRAELELLQAENDLAFAHVELSTRAAALNVLIGEPADSPLRVASPLTLEKAAVIAETPSLDTRPDLASARHALQLRREEARLVQLESAPALELQARRSASFGRQGSYALRAVVTVPLLDFGARRGKRNAAEAQARAQEAMVKLLTDQAHSQVATAQSRLDEAVKKLARYREKIVPLAQDLLRKSQIGYAQGATSYLEVLEAQRASRQIQAEYLRAILDVQHATVALDAARNGGFEAIAEPKRGVSQ